VNNRRWDTDTTGHGAGSAAQQVDAVEALIDAMRLPDWVAEEPEQHLLPHIDRACAREGSPWRLISSRTEGVVFVIELEWQRPAANLRQLAADAFSLVGLVAESNSHVRQNAGEDYVDFEVTTGMLDGDSQFRGHGHLLLLRCRGESVTRASGGRTA
jgi:hypothetical protein